jgi:lipopolysaccharide/colanic/teichoic acid biosynthesis glycosyltransferase
MGSNVITRDDLEASVPRQWSDSGKMGQLCEMRIRMLAEPHPFIPSIRRKPSRWSRSFAKRTFDLVSVLLFLPVVIPILLAVAIVVRLSSPGPTLFLQKRVGRMGRLFTIVKFRTLVHSPNTSKTSITTDRCQLVTPVGRFLRRWKLDELPQVFNVLRGDMSLVGVRPKLPEHQIAHLECRPGITGAATLAFAQESTVLSDVPKSQLDTYYRAVVLPAKWCLDIDYMAEATFLSDLRIIVNSATRRWDPSACSELLEVARTRIHAAPQ